MDSDGQELAVGCMRCRSNVGGQSTISDSSHFLQNIPKFSLCYHPCASFRSGVQAFAGHWLGSQCWAWRPWNGEVSCIATFVWWMQSQILVHPEQSIHSSCLSVAVYLAHSRSCQMILYIRSCDNWLHKCHQENHWRNIASYELITGHLWSATCIDVLW